MCIYFYSREDKNKTKSEDVTKQSFYGPAKTCEELLKIGYTRNGIYLVKGNTTSNSSHVEIVDCLFTHSNGAKAGIINLKKGNFKGYNTYLVTSLGLNIGKISQREANWCYSS